MGQSNYSRGVRRATWLALAVTFAGALAGSVMLGIAGPGRYFWLTFPMLVAVCVIAGMASGPWWRRLDDMQREGQLISWYWGGIGGGLVMLMDIVARTGVRDPLFTGGVLLLAGQSVGYVIYWAAWAWARRRPRTRRPPAATGP